jgi:hypothetical protein
MAIKPWSTSFPATQDPDDYSNQPNLTDESAPGAGDGDEACSDTVESLRDKLHATAKYVGDTNSLPTTSLRARAEKLKATSADTTPGFLNDKLTTSGGVTKSTTSPAGDEKIQLSLTYGTTANTVCQGNDGRLSDSRVPTSHTHAPGEVTGTAVVTNDARLSDARTPTAHQASHVSGTDQLPVAVAGVKGLAPALPNPTDNTVFLSGAGTYITPSAAAAAHAASHTTGADQVADVIAGGAHGLMTGADKTKLDGVAAGADVTGSNAPKAHAASHLAGDAIATVAAGAVGLCPALPNPADATKYLDGSGTFSVPPGGGLAGATMVQATKSDGDQTINDNRPPATPTYITELDLTITTGAGEYLEVKGSIATQPNTYWATAVLWYAVDGGALIPLPWPGMTGPQGSGFWSWFGFDFPITGLSAASHTITFYLSSDCNGYVVKGGTGPWATSSYYAKSMTWCQRHIA